MLAEAPVVTGRLLTFSVGSGRFAVLLEAVLGILEPAGTAAATGGCVLFHGREVAAFDVRRLWTDDVGPAAAPAAIIVGGGGEPTALLVDRVEGIVEGVEMRPLPALVAPFAREAFFGVTLHPDGSRLVIDPSALAGAAAARGQGGPGKA